MSRIEKLLKDKRQTQIAMLEGRLPQRTQLEINQELKSARDVRPHKKKRRRKTKRRSLYITHHAQQRMSQRGMTDLQVYAIWLYGERKPLKESLREAHVCTMRAYREMPSQQKQLVEKFQGAALIVQNPTPEDAAKGLRPAVLTVLADGKDTHFG